MLNCNAQNYYVNYFDKEDWAQMEENGAVFLTANGQLGAAQQGIHVSGLLDNGRNMHGYYWTSTTYYDEGKKQTYDFHLFFSDEAGYISTPSESAQAPIVGLGEAVRLVKDAGAPVGIKDVAAPAKDNTIRKVLINGKFYIMQGDNLFNAQGAQIR